MQVILILILIFSNVYKFDLSHRHRETGHILFFEKKKKLMISIFSEGEKLSYNQNFKYSSKVKNIGNQMNDPNEEEKKCIQNEWIFFLFGFDIFQVSS